MSALALRVSLGAEDGCVSDSEVDLPYMRVFSPRGAGVVVLGDCKSLLSRRRGIEAMAELVIESDRVGARETGTLVGGL